MSSQGLLSSPWPLPLLLYSSFTLPHFFPLYLGPVCCSCSKLPELFFPIKCSTCSSCLHVYLYLCMYTYTLYSRGFHEKPSFRRTKCHLHHDTSLAHLPLQSLLQPYPTQTPFHKASIEPGIKQPTPPPPDYHPPTQKPTKNKHYLPSSLLCSSLLNTQYCTSPSTPAILILAKSPPLGYGRRLTLCRTPWAYHCPSSIRTGARLHDGGLPANILSRDVKLCLLSLLLGAEPRRMNVVQGDAWYMGYVGGEAVRSGRGVGCCCCCCCCCCSFNVGGVESETGVLVSCVECTCTSSEVLGPPLFGGCWGTVVLLLSLSPCLRSASAVGAEEPFWWVMRSCTPSTKSFPVPKMVIPSI